MLLKLKRDDMLGLSELAWYWIVPLSNFAVYFLLVFLVFKILKIETKQLKDKNLILFNVGLIATIIIWSLSIIKVYIIRLEGLLYYLPMKNLLLVATLVLFLGILQMLLELKKDT
jgi:hypothetical protein